MHKRPSSVTCSTVLGSVVWNTRINVWLHFPAIESAGNRRSFPWHPPSACLPACLAAGLPAGLPFLLPVSRKRRAEEGERVKGQDGTKQQRQWRQDESCFVLCTQRYLICQRDKQEEGRGDSIEQRPSPGQTRNTAAAAAAAAAAASHLCTNMCRTCEE